MFFCHIYLVEPICQNDVARREEFRDRDHFETTIDVVSGVLQVSPARRWRRTVETLSI